MYGMVIAAVLTAHPAEPAFGNRSGQAAPAAAGCYGMPGGSGFAAGMSGCLGCQGCQGGGIFGIRAWFADLFSFGGCNGCMGCVGGSCSGCSGCMGCMGCIGGSCFGTPMSGCFGCHGVASYSYPIYTGPIGVTPSTPMTSPMTTPLTMPPAATVIGPPPRTMPDRSAGPARASVLFTLPPDARLYVDGQMLNLTGSTRLFETPDLIPGTDYYYQVRIEVDRGGRTLQQTRIVEVRPGQRSQMHFAEADLMQNNARLKVRVPDGAILTVEGRPWDTTTSGDTVTTPPLEPGRTYFYKLRAMWEKDGRAEVATKEVSFEAGGSVLVDLRAAASAVRVTRLTRPDDENADAPE